MLSLFPNNHTDISVATSEFLTSLRSKSAPEINEIAADINKDHESTKLSSIKAVVLYMLD